MKKKLQILTITFFISFLAYGQISENNTVPIYQYGESLTSCEVNFKNLFANWGSEYAANYKDIELLSYEYVETLKDNDRINHYADLLINPEMIIVGINKSGVKTVVKDSITRIIHFEQPYKHIPAKQLKDHFNTQKQDFRNIVHSGDKVYLVKVKWKNRVYEDYEICCSKTNKVICGLFLGVKK